MKGEAVARTPPWPLTWKTFAKGSAPERDAREVSDEGADTGIR